MDPISSYDGLLADDSLAPLKRNHACLACKKRKVKCDGVRPYCSPCLRSHAHALRAANRANVAPPVLCCEWAELETPEGSPGGSMDMDATISPDGPGSQGQPRRSSGDRVVGMGAKKKHSGPTVGKRTPAGGLEKERERRKEEEKEVLLARIADLEARLAGLTPPTSESNDSIPSAPKIAPAASSKTRMEYIQPAQPPPMNGMPFTDMTANQNFGTFSTNLIGSGLENWDFSSFFLIPVNWPKNLPAPYLLEHLIETFFSHVPQAPRMFNKAVLLSRIKLPANSPNFPYPALLHAICAQAAQHTAWVTSLPPSVLEETVQSTMKSGGDLELIGDFAFAQAESARRSIQQQTTICMMGPGQTILEMTQAQSLISEVYLLRGFPLMGWISAGVAGRFIKGLELLNRNKAKRYKAALLPDPLSRFEAEERLAVTWHTFIMESFWAIGSYWAPAIEHHEVTCRLPTSAAEFHRKDQNMAQNPQYARDEDLYRNHPMPDSFVLVCKAALLCSRAAAFLRRWSQRDIVPGDEMLGMQDPEFIKIVRDIHDFQVTTPAALKNIFQFGASDAQMFGGNDANILSLHMMPHIALMLLHEPFLNWEKPEQGPVSENQKAYEAVIGLIHVIPSNLDVSIILSPVVIFNLYVCGRFIADFVRFALQKQAYGLAVRYRADIMTIQGLMNRFGSKHPLGIFVCSFLDMYLEVVTRDHTAQPDANVICDAVSRARSMHSDALAETALNGPSLTTLPSLDQSVNSMSFNDIAQRAWKENYSASMSTGSTPPSMFSNPPPDGITARAKAMAEQLGEKFKPGEPSSAAQFDPGNIGFQMNNLNGMADFDYGNLSGSTGLTPFLEIPPSTPDLLAMLYTTPDSSSSYTSAPKPTPPMQQNEVQFDPLSGMGAENSILWEPAKEEKMLRSIIADRFASQTFGQPLGLPEQKQGPSPQIQGFDVRNWENQQGSSRGAAMPTMTSAYDAPRR